MSGRNLFVFVVLMLMTLLMAGNARAQQPVVGVDGCAILALLVYTEVTEAGYRGARVSGDLVYPGPDEITICNQTTRSVTAAFSSSLRHMNIHVSWGYHPRDSGDYCLSHYLSQCYPDCNSNMPRPGTMDTAFVLHSWRAVHDAIRRTMPAVSGSDVARFSQSGLRRDIRQSLATYRGSR